ncbi:HAD family phosphatase [Streptomyces sp. TS71-3]|uniref:HAD family hydrolase n=1 Tax=Streptomyces sp. TS71-3 TaxID=2733862 RepID=UPI001B26E01B|nr:HAD family phosphatase [Streptomyces sp. TS71-3]GHJ35456.1 haloacid dehalogenase [Streptomyces sp. TS71-3]
MSRHRLPYQALILDFGGVLTVGIREAHEAWCMAEGLPVGAWEWALGQHPEGRRLYRALETGAMAQHEWNRRTARILGLEDHHDLMGRAWRAVRPATQMIDLARTACAAGMKLALLSNSFGTDPFNPYTHCGVWELFDVHVISEREQVAKPDPLIYQRALEHLGVPGQQCLFVDDNEANLPPAQALGITTVCAATEAETVAMRSVDRHSGCRREGRSRCR